MRGNNIPVFLTYLQVEDLLEKLGQIATALDPKITKTAKRHMTVKPQNAVCDILNGATPDDLFGDMWQNLKDAADELGWYYGQ